MRFISDHWYRMRFPDQYTTGDWLFFAAYCAIQVAAVIGGAILLSRLIY